MKKMISHFICLFTVMMPSLIFAQVTVTGEIRPRVENRHGYQSPLDSTKRGSTFTTQRTRLNFGYGSEKVKAAISIQDVRTWGAASQQVSAYADAPTFLHQAWGQYLFTPSISMKVGRQEISYDDERMFGGVNWSQQGRAHDAMLLMYQDTSSNFSVHVGIAYNQNSAANTATAYSVASSYKEMHYLWLNKKFGNLAASLLFLNLGNQSPVSTTSTRFSQTAGTHLAYNKKPFSSNLKFYYQTGVDANLKDLQAYMFGFDFHYNITSKFTAGIGVEYLSGQSQTDTTMSYQDVNHVFTPFFGTNHKFNGYMDYFYAGSGHSNVGLTDVHLKLRYKSEKWWAALNVHQFMTAADALDQKELAATGEYKAMDSNLGNEIDFEFAYIFNPAFTLQLGYSHYLPSETLSYLKGVKDYKGDGYTSETANWAYLMFIFKPTLFK